MLYGNDIGKSKRILFNIYSSDEKPIMVPEMQEIDDFFDHLNPNIDVIFGLSTDQSLGEDAKVTILATGMDGEHAEDEGTKDDSYYADLIPKLYKPVVKHVEAPVEPPTVIINNPVEPEPAIEPEEEDPKEEKEPTILEKWKSWLNSFLQDTDEE